MILSKRLIIVYQHDSGSSIQFLITRLCVSYLTTKNDSCGINVRACDTEHLSQQTVQRSLVFFIREGHVQRTSEDKQLFIRDSKLVFQLLSKKKIIGASH